MEATIVSPTLIEFVLRNQRTDEELPIAAVTVIGREEDCQLRLREGHVSRYHAKLSIKGAVIWIEDLNSTNGTYVNAKRIKEPQALQIGDELCIDSHKFRLASNKSGGAANTMFLPPLGDSAEAIPTADTAGAPSPIANNPSASVEPSPAVPGDPVLSDPLPSDIVSTRTIDSGELERLLAKSVGKRKTLGLGEGHRFVVLTAPLRGQVFELKDALSWTIGRSENADICLKDKSISAQHAKVFVDKGQWFIEELDATNGLFINARATGSSILKSNDVIRFGRMEMQIELDNARNPQTMSKKSARMVEEHMQHIGPGDLSLLGRLRSAFRTIFRK